MISRDAYESFAQGCESLPVFLQPWWLDAAVGPDSWHAVVSEYAGNVCGVWPVPVQKKWGFIVAGMPALTPYLGPWIAVPSSVSAQKSEFVRSEILQDLLTSLPPVDLFYQTLAPGFMATADLTFAGFSSTVYHTRIITHLPEWSSSIHLQSRARTKLSKAAKQFAVEEIFASERALQSIIQPFVRQKMEAQFPQHAFTNLWNAAFKHNAIRAWVVKDSKDVDHACSVTLHCKGNATYWVAGVHSDARNTGAGTLCATAAIENHQSSCTSYNLEGSMIPGIDYFLSSFGGSEVPMLHIWKNRSRILKTREALNQLLGRVAHP